MKKSKKDVLQMRETDKLLDDYLRRQRVLAKDDFTARTLRRIRAEAVEDEQLDRWLDSLLERQPVQVPATFTAEVLSRMPAPQSPERFSGPLFRPFLGSFARLGGMAAALLLGLGLWSWQPFGEGLFEKESTAGEAISGSAPVAAAWDDPVLREALALAEGLRGASPLLNESAHETLASLVH